MIKMSKCILPEEEGMFRTVGTDEKAESGSLFEAAPRYGAKGEESGRTQPETFEGKIWDACQPQSSAMTMHASEGFAWECKVKKTLKKYEQE